MITMSNIQKQLIKSKLSLLVHMHYETIFTHITEGYFFTGPLPHLVHRMDCTHWMNNYSKCCFLPIVQGMVPGLIYKPCSQDRIVHFLGGFAMVLISFTNINEFILTTPCEVNGFSPHFTDES